MNEQIKVIAGGSHTDERGTICFINDFDMSDVKRFYRIKHPNTTTVRGWRGHKIEQRWFHVYKGCFEVSLVKINNWENPEHSNIEAFILKESDNLVLHVPPGYASCLRALEENAELNVFADYPVSHARNDDYLYPSDYFENIIKR